MPRRVLIIGWDGVDWKVLRPMLDAGELPTLAALVERGAYGDCLSTVPSHSWCAWPSFMTGLNPAGHGVFDILEHKPGVSKRLPVTYRSIKARTVFDDLSAAGRTTIAANIPLTFPAPEIKGKVIAGGVLPASRSYTHPVELQNELDARAPFPVNGMSWTTFRNRPEPFLDEAAEITAKRQKTFEYLLDTTEWDFGVLVYVSTDRIQHCLMEYVSPDHPDYERLKDTPVGAKTRAVYRQLDDGLAALLKRTTDDDLVMFMSDHGHQPCTRACTMDRILAHLGYLQFGRGSFAFNLIRWGPGRRVARRIYDLLKLHGKVSIPASPIEWSKTRAYTSVVSTGEGVSVNLKGREPGGIVEPRDYERVRDEVAAALEELRDPDTGDAPIRKIYRKEEVLSGRFLDVAPDLLLVPAPFYSLTHAKGMIEAADWLSGDHRLEGVLVATGPEVVPGPLSETARLIDLAPTALAALGVPSAIPRDGTVLRSLAGDAELVVSGDGGNARAVDEAGLTSDEEGEIEDHLRGLGYVE
ncbi:MAG TPA: alkaline phosphatase family protein [Actinomycetota bacterium]|nr:alkaline phosphatase family protein [Actinomycetota bacterium]